MVTQPKDEQLKINAQIQATAAGRAPKVLGTHVPWHGRHRNRRREKHTAQSSTADTHCRCWSPGRRSAWVPTRLAGGSAPVADASARSPRPETHEEQRVQRAHRAATGKKKTQTKLKWIAPKLCIGHHKRVSEHTPRDHRPILLKPCIEPRTPKSPQNKNRLDLWCLSEGFFRGSP
jgi:hypothetical protein